MKKINLSMFFMIGVLLLCSCTINREASTDNKDAFIVNIINNTEDRLYEIHFNYSADGKVFGGGGTCNADHSLIKKGEVFSKDFIPQDFPDSNTSSKFSIDFSVMDSSQNEHPVAGTIELDIKYGSSCNVSLKGNSNQGYTAKLKQ